MKDIHVLILCVLLILLIVFGYRYHKENYTIFDCVSVYGNQDEYLRCLRQINPNCKDASELHEEFIQRENFYRDVNNMYDRDYADMFDVTENFEQQLDMDDACKNKCMLQCGIQKGMFEECCGRCMRERCLLT